MYTITQHAIERFKQRVESSKTADTKLIIEGLLAKSRVCQPVTLFVNGVQPKPGTEYRQAVFRSKKGRDLRVFFVIAGNTVVTCYLNKYSMRIR